MNDSWEVIDQTTRRKKVEGGYIYETCSIERGTAYAMTMFGRLPYDYSRKVDVKTTFVPNAEVKA